MGAQLDEARHVGDGPRHVHEILSALLAPRAAVLVELEGQPLEGDDDVVVPEVALEQRELGGVRGEVADVRHLAGTELGGHPHPPLFDAAADVGQGAEAGLDVSQGGADGEEGGIRDGGDPGAADGGHEPVEVAEYRLGRGRDDAADIFIRDGLRYSQLEEGLAGRGRVQTEPMWPSRQSCFSMV